MSRADSFNPYETPRAEIGVRPEEFRRLPAAPFSVGEVMSRGWATYQARAGLALGLLIVGGLLNFVVSILQNVIVAMTQQAVEPGQGAVAAVSIVTSLASMLFNFFINVGQTLAFLKIARGEPARIGDIFAGGPFVMKLVLATIPLGLVSSLGLGIGAIPGIVMMQGSGMQDPTAIAWLVIGILVMATILSVFWVRVSQYMYAGVDYPGLGAMDTIRRSIDLTRGHFWGISTVYLLLFLMNIGGLLLLGVGLLLTAPLTMVTLATMYTLLAGDSTLVEEKPAPEFLA